MSQHARFLATLLTGFALACLLAVSLWPEVACRACAADIQRDRVLIGVGR
jgi:hypothetical protein